jgi:hypothetical protein
MRLAESLGSPVSSGALLVGPVSCRDGLSPVAGILNSEFFQGIPAVLVLPRSVTQDFWPSAIGKGGRYPVYPG